MYRVKTRFGTVGANDGTQCVFVTDEIGAELDRWFGSDWLGLFERRGAELQAHWSGCTSRHENPRLASFETNPRPHLPGVEQLKSAVIGASILLQLPLPQPIGVVWVPGKVISTPRLVALSTGKALPADTPAALITAAEHIPSDGRADLSADGTPWRRNKDGLQRIARFCNIPTTLGALAEAGASQVLVSEGGRWTSVVLA